MKKSVDGQRDRESERGRETATPRPRLRFRERRLLLLLLWIRTPTSRAHLDSNGRRCTVASLQIAGVDRHQIRLPASLEIDSMACPIFISSTAVVATATRLLPPSIFSLSCSLSSSFTFFSLLFPLFILTFFCSLFSFSLCSVPSFLAYLLFATVSPLGAACHTVFLISRGLL